MSDQDWIKVAEVCRILDVSRSRVTRMAQAGILERKRTPRCWLYLRSDVEWYKVNKPPVGRRPKVAGDVQ